MPHLAMSDPSWMVGKVQCLEVSRYGRSSTVAYSPSYLLSHIGETQRDRERDRERTVVLVFIDGQPLFICGAYFQLSEDDNSSINGKKEQKKEKSSGDADLMYRVCLSVAVWQHVPLWCRSVPEIELRAPRYNSVAACPIVVQVCP